MRILLFYSTMTGNTEDMAIDTEEELISRGHEVELMDMIADGLPNEDPLPHDLLIMGTYTWGEGDIPEETEDFLEDLFAYDMSGLSISIFGSGDHAYENFAGAVDEMIGQFRERGHKGDIPTMKVDVDEMDNIAEDIKSYVDRIEEKFLVK